MQENKLFKSIFISLQFNDKQVLFVMHSHGSHGFVRDATMPIIKYYFVFLFLVLSIFQRFCSVACPFSVWSLILKCC